ncbi:hypothetical protein EZS27_027879 [termite gut metagenome]|uniref:Uncharacterized protein n=1 Tax=termite gut metagenome TaxID=433724 RepID=A0A5J4QN92_9ZZZZ
MSLSTALSAMRLLRMIRLYIGGTDPQLNLKQHDNVVAIQYNSGGWKTEINLPWNIEHSGRRICIVNYKWGTAITTGAMDITAPAGKYFYEDGIAKSTLSFSREVVELLGYGDNSTFFGWIVVNRQDIMTNSKYGSNQKYLAQGSVTVEKISGTIRTAIRYKTFDGSSMSVSRLDTGKYQVVHNIGTSIYGYANWGIFDRRGDRQGSFCYAVQRIPVFFYRLYTRRPKSE